MKKQIIFLYLLLQSSNVLAKETLDSLEDQSFKNQTNVKSNTETQNDEDEDDDSLEKLEMKIKQMEEEKKKREEEKEKKRKQKEYLEQLQKEKEMEEQQEKEQELQQQKEKEIKEKEKESQTKEKHGDHLYDHDESVTWEDTFKEEVYDIEEKVETSGEMVRKLYREFLDLAEIVGDMGYGFLDNGKSFDKGYVILDKYFNFHSFLSQRTLNFIQMEKEVLMQSYDFPGGYEVFQNFMTERITNFYKYFQPVQFVENVLGYIFLSFVTLPGKVNALNPLFTATIPSIVGLNIIVISIAFNISVNKWWASGNLLLLLLQAFTIVQFVFLWLLLWNTDVYLYDLRIVRYLSLISAIIFNIFYFTGICGEADLIFVKGRMEKTDNPIDVFLGLITGYVLLDLAPTAYVNLLIVLKELTLNQFAWNKKKEFKEGKLFGIFDTNILQWFGISEDPQDYLDYLKKWATRFL